MKRKSPNVIVSKQHDLSVHCPEGSIVIVLNAKDNSISLVSNIRAGDRDFITFKDNAVTIRQEGTWNAGENSRPAKWNSKIVFGPAGIQMEGLTAIGLSDEKPYKIQHELRDGGRYRDFAALKKANPEAAKDVTDALEMIKKHCPDLEHTSHILNQMVRRFEGFSQVNELS